jgi:hypothetical protein
MTTTGSSKQIAIDNITRFKAAIAANGHKPQLVKTLKEQILHLEMKWGLTKANHSAVDVITPFTTVKPAYRNSKYAIEKYAKVDAKKADALGRYYQPKKSVAKHNHQDNTISTWGV